MLRSSLTVSHVRFRILDVPTLDGDHGASSFTMSDSVRHNPVVADPQYPAVNKFVETMIEYTGKRPKVGGSAISCDLAIYGENGNMPAVIIGPRGDNLHAPDEWVLIEDLFTLTGIFALLAASWCG